MSELIGPGRDRHTEEFAESLCEDENIEQSTIVEERTDVDAGQGKKNANCKVISKYLIIIIDNIN